MGKVCEGFVMKTILRLLLSCRGHSCFVRPLSFLTALHSLCPLPSALWLHRKVRFWSDFRSYVATELLFSLKE